MAKEHRTESREQVSLPLKLAGGGTGLTSDISASGLFFETDSNQHLGGLIDFEIELDTPGGPMKLKVQGQIVRLLAEGGRTGVGVKMLSSRLESVE